MSGLKSPIYVILSVTGAQLQIGLTLLARRMFTSLFDMLSFVALRIGLLQADYITHLPPSPIVNSVILSLELFFIGIILLTMVTAYFMNRWRLSK